MRNEMILVWYFHACTTLLAAGWKLYVAAKTAR
jgi:hypothetical protein